MRLSRDATAMTNTSFAPTPERGGGTNIAGRHSRGEVSAIKRSALGTAPSARPNARRSPRTVRSWRSCAVTVLRSCGANCVPATPLSAGRSKKGCEPSGEWPERNCANRASTRAPRMRSSPSGRRASVSPSSNGIATMRAALTASLARSTVWRTWLESQAAAGDEAVQAGLRGIRYREQRKRKEDERDRNNGIEGEALDPLEALHERLRRGPDDLVLATLTADRDRRGSLRMERCVAWAGLAAAD